MKWLLLQPANDERSKVSSFSCHPVWGMHSRYVLPLLIKEDSVLLEPFKPTQSSLRPLKVWDPPLLQSLAESHAVPERDKTFLNSSGEGTGVYFSSLVERNVPILLPSFRFQTIIKTVKPEMLLHIYWITKL